MTATKTRCKMIGYYRVSTDKQGESGLGLEGQVRAVESYVGSSGCKLVATFTEVESGKRNDRPELAKALAHAKRTGATLVFAKLDRLARNASFLLSIIESGADVVFADMPNIPAGATGKFLLSMMASVAEMEAGLISERTKAALASYKARGGLLGASRPECRNLDHDARVRGAENAGKAVRSNAIEAYADLLPLMVEMRDGGSTLQQIAEALNEAGHTTRQGAMWSSVQVMRALKRTGK